MQETLPCTHGPSLYMWMSAVVGAVLIAYDYEWAKELSASLFLGSQKQAFLASWLWALTVLTLALNSRVPSTSTWYGQSCGLTQLYP